MFFEIGLYSYMLVLNNQNTQINQRRVFVAAVVLGVVNLCNITIPHFVV
jgi:hypothetical protein